MEPQMISDFNNVPCDGPLWVWIVLGALFIPIAGLIVVHGLLYSNVVLGINLIRNANDRRLECEDEKIQKEEEIEALKAEIVSLEGSNERLMDLARRKGSTLVTPKQEKRPERLYTAKERAEMWGSDGDNIQ